MSQPPKEISLRLQRVKRDDGTGERWLVMPLQVGGVLTLTMVPNSVALRSVVTPEAFAKLRSRHLVGANITHLQSGRHGCVWPAFSVQGHPLQAMEFQVREVPELRAPDGQNEVDGFLGLEFFWTNLSAIRFEFRTFRLTLEV